MKKIIILLLFSTFVLNRGFSQITSENDSLKSDLDSKIMLRLDLSTETDHFFYRNDNTEERIDLKANNNYKLSINFAYHFISFGIGFAPDLFSGSREEELKGKSSFTDIQFRLFPKNWVQFFQYKNVKGYYVDNTHDFIDGWREGRDPYIQFSNLQNLNIGMATAYVLNEDYSFRNLVSLNDWQFNSAGSIVPALVYNYNKISFDIGDTSSQERFYNVRFNLGYYYTWVLNDHWFIAPNIRPSIGLRFSKTETEINSITTVENNTDFTRFIEGGLRLAYRSKRFVLGSNLNFSASWYNTDDNAIAENDQVFGDIYIGYRLDPPKFLKNTYNNLMDKVEKKKSSP